MRYILFLILCVPLLLDAQITRGRQPGTGYTKGYTELETRNVMGDTATVLRSDMSDSLNIKTSAKDTTTLKTMSFDSTGRTVYLEGLSSTNSNGGGGYVERDSSEIEGSEAFDHPTAGKQWISIDFLRDNEHHIDSTNISSVLSDFKRNHLYVTFPPGTTTVDTTLYIYSNTFFKGFGYTSTTLSVDGDYPFFEVNAVADDGGSTTRQGFSDMTFQGDYSNDEPMFDLNYIITADFENVRFWQGKNGVFFRGGSQANLLTFRNCSFLLFDEYALKVQGHARTLFFDKCWFEKDSAGNAGSSILIDIDMDRPFGHVAFTESYFEEVKLIDIKDQNVHFNNCYFSGTKIVFGERTSSGRIQDGSWANNLGYVIDLGYNNDIEFLSRNSGFMPVKIGSFESELKASNDTVFTVTHGDEYLFQTAVNYHGADTVVNQTVSYIRDRTGADSILYTSTIDSMANHPSEANSSAHRATTIFTNYQLCRADTTGGGTGQLKIREAIANADIYISTKKNQLTNGAFYDTSYTGWSNVNSPTIAEGDTAGYYAIGDNQAFGIYQAVSVIAGHTYMLMALTVDSLDGCLRFGSAWSSQGNIQTALSSPVSREDGKFMNVCYLKARDNEERISFGNPSADTIQVAWIALVDLDDTGELSVTGRTTLLSGLTGNAAIRGTNAFTTTAAADTVLVAGLLSTDFVLVAGKYVGGVDQQDVLQAEVKTDTLIVHRLSSGESAGAYNYTIIR